MNAPHEPLALNVIIKTYIGRQKNGTIRDRIPRVLILPVIIVCGHSVR